MHHSTSWWVSALRSNRIVGSPATRRARFLASASSSERVLATIATGSNGSGISQASTSSGLSLAEMVSPVSAVVDLVSATMSPAMQVGTSRTVEPSGEYRWAKRSSASWSGWPRSARPWPEMCTAVSGRSVPENTRTRLTRPTYGSMVVLTTSATSGPLGSQVSGARGVASRPVTAGSGCSSGDGKPLTSTSSSASRPSRVSAQTGITG